MSDSEGDEFDFAQFLPKKYEPSELPKSSNSVGPDEGADDFPKPSAEHIDELVLAVKPGDFIRWIGYTDEELAFFHELHQLKGGTLGLEDYITAYRAMLLEKPEYGVVWRVLDGRTEECRVRYMGSPGISREDYEKSIARTPVIVNAHGVGIEGESDYYRGTSFWSYDHIQSRNPYDLHRVVKVGKREALASLVNKARRYQAKIQAARESDDETKRLYACIDARKQFRLAELYLALHAPGNALATIKEHKSGSIIEPKTGFYVVMPIIHCLVPKQDPALIHIIDSGRPQLDRDRREKFAEAMLPGLFGQGSDSYLLFAVPESAKGLVERMEPLILERPAVTKAKIVDAPTEKSPEAVERFLLELASQKGLPEDTSKDDTET